jgi:hypothetical protein
MQLQMAFYIVATHGNSTSLGRITYTVMGRLLLGHANTFFDNYLNRIRKLLIPFYRMSNINELQEAPPNGLDKSSMVVLTILWPFFKAVHEHAIEEIQSKRVWKSIVVQTQKWRLEKNEVE